MTFYGFAKGTTFYFQGQLTMKIFVLIWLETHDKALANNQAEFQGHIICFNRTTRLFQLFLDTRIYIQHRSYAMNNCQREVSLETWSNYDLFGVLEEFKNGTPH